MTAPFTREPNLIPQSTHFVRSQLLTGESPLCHYVTFPHTVGNHPLQGSLLTFPHTVGNHPLQGSLNNPSVTCGDSSLYKVCAICHSKHVANPGCFATCIQLGLLPLAKHLLLNEDVMVNAITGSTGAGVKPGATSHFSWRNNNMSIYKPFSHQHVPEIKQSLKQLQNSFNAEIDFIPYRGDFPRGIFATLVVKCKVELEELVKMYQDYYAEDSFVHIVDKNIDLKQVVNTNKCLIHLEKHGDKLLVISCIDNLLKGASGQAVHNMNLMFNLEETVGLRLKPSAF